MERGLLVELSPNEETALQRIAQGVMLTMDMQERHLVRLKQLALIEETGTDFKLTAIGRRRACTARIGTAEATRLGVRSEVALRNDCPLSIRYAYDFEAFLPEMFQRCQGLSAGGTDDHNGGTGVSRFNNKIHDCTRH
jgi:hypothetical protein